MPLTCAQNRIRKPFSSAQQSPAQITTFRRSRSFHTQKLWDATQTHSGYRKPEILLQQNACTPAFSSIRIHTKLIAKHKCV